MPFTRQLAQVLKQPPRCWLHDQLAYDGQGQCGPGKPAILLLPLSKLRSWNVEHLKNDIERSALAIRQDGGSATRDPICNKLLDHRRADLCGAIFRQAFRRERRPHQGTHALVGRPFQRHDTPFGDELWVCFSQVSVR